MGRRQELMPGDHIPEIALECVFGYIDSAADRSAISRVSKKWYSVDTRTRKEVTIACCYAVHPACLTRRFKALETVKLKGKPRASMFKLIPDDWGGHATPWIAEIAVNCLCLKYIHLRRMIVTDEDIFTLARERGYMLQVLKLDRCSGFSTIGLEAIANTCRSLRVLLLDESLIEDHGSNWLRELALRNTSLEVLNFSGTDLQKIEMVDLIALALNCKSLISLKLNEMDLESLTGLLSRTKALRELGGVTVGSSIAFDIHPIPAGLTSLVGLYYTGVDEGDAIVNSLIRPIARDLRKLDLQCAFLSVDGHCQLLGVCSNLECVEVFNAVGDEGLEVIANNCKRLRRLRVESGDKEVQPGFVTHKGLISVALNCHNLEYLAAYVSDINNAALLTIAHNCPKMKDFRLVLLDDQHVVSDYPLDQGVRTLMQMCREIHRFALYLRPGFLTDKGMEEVGKFGHNLRWALFGLLGESDMGLIRFADGCQKLERLEIRDCIYSEKAIASSVLKMSSLKFVWVQGYKMTGTGQDLLPMRQEYWNVELMPAVESAQGFNHPAHFVAYRSLAGKRKDNPETVICIG